MGFNQEIEQTNARQPKRTRRAARKGRQAPSPHRPARASGGRITSRQLTPQAAGGPRGELTVFNNL